MKVKFENEDEPIKRPTLLTVLCVLSFVGSSYSIAGSVYSYRAAHFLSANIHRTLDKKMGDTINNGKSYDSLHKKPSIIKVSRIMKDVEKTYDEKNLRKKALGDILAAIFTLGGAILMWNQRRVGYFLYIAGVFIGGVLPFYLYGNNLMAIGISSFGSFFGLIFIALYALNLSYFNESAPIEY